MSNFLLCIQACYLCQFVLMFLIVGLDLKCLHYSHCLFLYFFIKLLIINFPMNKYNANTYEIKYGLIKVRLDNNFSNVFL